MLRYFYCFSFFIIISVINSRAQELKIGDKFPDLKLSDVFNYKSNELRFSDFKNKLIILDFWGTGCVSCLKSFPKLDSLQKQFNDQIQIILVNKESKQFTKNFFETRKQIKLPSLPFVTSDTMLRALFPNEIIPFYIWIDKSGVIKYFSSNLYVSGDNIKKVLEKKIIDVSRSEKKEKIETVFDDQWKDNVKFYSYIFPCQKNLELISGKKTDSIVRISYNCMPIVKLYQMAFNGQEGSDLFLRPGRTILEIIDSSKYVVPRKNTDQYYHWYENHAYSYQLQIPASKKNKLFQIILDDFNRYFDLKPAIETRIVKCFTLIRTSQEDKLKTKGGKPGSNFSRSYERTVQFDSVRYMLNKPFRLFAAALTNMGEHTFLQPFVDKTGYEGNIDIEINGRILDKFDLKELRTELNKYDIDLVETECEIKVLVLRQEYTINKKEIVVQ